MTIMPSRQSALWWAAIVAAVIVYLVRDFFHDDAFITLRYAQNVLAGHGAVWNPGEYVQGYTNFLLLMLVSVLGFFGLDLVSAARLVGMVSFTGLIVVLWYFRSRSAADAEKDALLIATVMVLTSAPLLVWSLGGLETVLFSFLVTAGCLAFLYSGASFADARMCAASGFLLGLACLTRPDGVVCVGVAGLWLLATAGRDSSVYRRLFLFATCVAVVVLPYAVWQLFYYGDIVPNTFYAKAGTPPLQRLIFGWSYLKSFALQPPFLPLLLAGTLVAVTLKGAWNRQLRLLSSFIAAYLLFVLYAGGDHMQAFRFFAPVIPLLCVTLGMACSALVADTRRLVLPVCSIGLMLAIAQLGDTSVTPRGKDDAAREGSLVGRYINNNWPDGSLIALHTAGSTPYFGSKHRYIDMLGLNDAHIAKRKVSELLLPWQNIPGHSKGDGAYVLSREPDYIIAGPALGKQVENPWFLSDLELALNPDFDRLYKLRHRLIFDDAKPEDGVRVLTYYQRRN